jgi:Zn-dependent protease with chaperone function
MTRTPLSERALRVALAACLTIPALAVAPSTPQLPDPGHSGMSREQQQKLGLQAMSEVYKQIPVLPDSSPVAQYVQHLGAKLVRQIPQPYTWPYQFHVIEQKEINAFALPGGPIFINVGTIAAAQNEAQLAGVVSHEMSHVYMQHSAKQATSSKRALAEILGAAAGVLGGNVFGDWARAGIQFGAGTLLLRYSREDEAQADAVGAIVMYKAGYNPIELANFFEMLKQQGGSPPQFLSDHPNPGNRTQAIEKEIRTWPPKNYNTDNANFLSARATASRVRAYSAQEISDGAKQGRWAKQNMDSGAVPESARETVSASANGATVLNVSLDQVRPSNEFTRTQQNWFSISYPANWSVAPGQNSVTIAPRAGVGQNAIAYGVVISQAQDQTAGSLDQAAQDFVQSLERRDPGMRKSGEMRNVEVNRIASREIDLTSNSPIQQQNGIALPERDRLVVIPSSGTDYVSLIFVAPEKDFDALEPTFQKMLESLRFE